MCCEEFFLLSPEGHRMGLEPPESLGQGSYPWGALSICPSEPAVFWTCCVVKRSGSSALRPSSMLPPPQSLFPTLQPEVSLPPFDASPGPSGLSYSLLCIMGIYCFSIGIFPASLPQRIGSSLRILFLFSYRQCLELVLHVLGTP